MVPCGWCKRPLSPGEERAAPRFVRYGAAFALAFLHAGMWAMEWLDEPFCVRCRAVIVPAVVALVAVETVAVVWLARLWLGR